MKSDDALRISGYGADDMVDLLEEIESEPAPDRLVELARRLQTALRERTAGDSVPPIAGRAKDSRTR